MAFPVVAATNTSAETADAASHTVNLPTGIVSVDLLIIFFGRNNSADDIDTPTGWTQFFDAIAATAPRMKGFYRQADGAEGGTVTVTTTGGAVRSAHNTYRITGHEDPATQAPEATTAIGDSTAPDSPSLSPTGGAEDFLWLAVASDRRGRDFTADPTSYTDGVLGESGDGAGHVDTRSARRELNAASEDPGSFTIDTIDDWAAATIAIHPAAGADVTGAAALAVSGTLASIAVATLIGISSLLGSGDVSATAAGASPCIDAGVIISGISQTYNGAAPDIGRWETGGAVTHSGVAVLDGTGDLISVAAGIFIGASVLAGTGAVTPAGVLTIIGQVALAGAGALTSIGRRIFAGITALAGSGTVAAIGQGIFTGIASLVGTGIAVIEGIITAIGQVILAGGGAVTSVAIAFPKPVALSDYYENQVIDHMFRNVAFTPPATLYLALYTSIPDDTGGTEASGGAYARTVFTFTAASAGVTSNVADITFSEATADWGRIVAYGIFDALTAGNLLAWGHFEGTTQINSGQAFRVDAGNLDLTVS